MSTHLHALIEAKAEEHQLSLNKTIQILLEKALGIQESTILPQHDFAEFCGVWKQKDLQEFAMATKDFENIDAGDWA